MADIYLDLTELVRSPIRSGIQRVEGELVRYWPDELPFRIARFDAARGMVARLASQKALSPSPRIL